MRQSLSANCEKFASHLRSRRSGFREPGHKLDQPNEVVVPEVGPAGADHHGRMRGLEIRPRLRDPAQLTRVVLKEDAVLTPGRPGLDQLEDAAVHRMERMRDSKGLSRTTRRLCNRRLTPTASRNALCERSGQSASTGC